MYVVGMIWYLLLTVVRYVCTTAVAVGMIHGKVEKMMKQSDDTAEYIRSRQAFLLDCI